MKTYIVIFSNSQLEYFNAESFFDLNPLLKEYCELNEVSVKSVLLL